MKKIQQLSSHVADLIAAGEVVERPSSVIKELVENSIDAGATAITVEIEKGGLTYMRVSDNGTGIPKEDAATAFLRHATSKLESGRDLEAIETLGFRGEALAAIASVSRIDLFTRTKEEAEGIALTLEAGTVVEQKQVGTPEGTTVIVRDLFYNTPARLKFMKSDRAEAAAITALLTAIAMSHPDVSLRYLRDNKEEFHTPGDNSIRSTVYMLLGRTFAKDLIEFQGEDSEVSVKGFITAPALSRGSRSHQYFYVNNRLVRSKILQAALEQAYKNVQFTGRFPACVLYVDLKHHLVDVNVHPTKAEVKFLYEKQVFDAVYYGVLAALKENRFMPELSLSKGTRQALGTTVNETPKAEFTPVPDENTAPPPPMFPASNNNIKPQTKPMPTIPFDEGFLEQVTEVLYRGKEAVVADEPLFKEEKETEVSGATAEDTSAPVTVSHRVIGEALGTYILVEQGDALYFIDKHAAHERILFDKLKAENYKPMPQTLLAPITVQLGALHTAILADYAHLLEPFGFSYNQFSSDTLALRSLPGDIVDIDEVQSFLAEIAEGITLGKSPNLEKVRDKILHVLACKGAIKAGKRSDLLEIQALAALVLDGTVQYCPHGRPVFLRLDRSSLDRQVRR